MEERLHDLLFYDGACGLCHRLVKFVIARDLEGTRFCFAPLGGSTFAARYAESERRDLPDSVVIRTADGRTLVRSAAVIYIGERLGGGWWRSLARLVNLLPRWFLDLGYDGVARIRGALFAKPTDTCPVLPAELRGRFLP